MVKKIKILFREFWRQIIIIIGVIILFSFLLLSRLGTQPAALSSSEVIARSSSSTVKVISHNPVNAPFTLFQHFSIHERPMSVKASRIVTVVFAAITLLLLFIILRFWHGNFAAGAGTAMCATSAWFLGVARLGTPEILLFSVLALVACGLWIKHSHHRNIVLFISVLVVGFTFYVPGMIWFMLAAAIWQRRTIYHELMHIKLTPKIIAIILLACILIPLIFSIVRQPLLLRPLLGLPMVVPSPMLIVRNFYHIPLTLFAWSPADPVHWLGHLPLLDFFEDAMFIFGVYSFWVSRKLGRSKYLLGTALVGVALITIGGPVTITVLLPAVFITLTVGVLYVWELWLSVFPNNPLARGLGLVMLILSIVISCNYQLHRYFIAWPHAPATRAVFTHKPVNFDTITTLQKE